MTSNGKQFTVTREMLTAVARDRRWPDVVAGISAFFSIFAFVSFCCIRNRLMTGPLGNREFCFPGISMLLSISSRETLRFSGNKIHCAPRDQPFSVNWYRMRHRTREMLDVLIYLILTEHSVIANLSLGNTTGNCNLRDPRFSNQHTLRPNYFLLNKLCSMFFYRNSKPHLVISIRGACLSHFYVIFVAYSHHEHPKYLNSTMSVG